MRDDWVKAMGRVAASRGEVWNALTDIEKLIAWWSAGWSGCWIEGGSIQAVDGGSFDLHSRTKRDREHYVRGRFLAVSDEQLFFTWDSDASSSFTSAVSIRLTEVNDETELAIHHVGLEVDVERDRARIMWRQFLAVLARGLPRLTKVGIARELSKIGGGATQQGR